MDPAALVLLLILSEARLMVQFLFEFNSLTLPLDIHPCGHGTLGMETLHQEQRIRFISIVNQVSTP